MEDNKFQNYGEVVFSNYGAEFKRFFNFHKNVCDEISGLKQLDDKFITEYDFIRAIKRLYAFITDFKYSIDDNVKEQEMDKLYDKLHKDFINDYEYHTLIKKGGNITNSQKIELNQKYINYILRCFEISHLLCKYLQNSLNIAPGEIIKTLQFIDYSIFYNNLSIYRDEIVNELSNLSILTLFTSFKKILSFYYTYKYLINVKLQKIIDKTFKDLYNVITSEETKRYILKIKENNEITISVKNDIDNYLEPIRKALSAIYYGCNKIFSKKNILPKSKKKIFVDRTLI